MSEAGKTEVTAIVPGSATDLIKAVREALGLVGDLVKGGEWVIELYDGHKRKSAARNLETLRFTKAGSKPHLEKIISGNFTKDDIEAIGRQMAETAGEVENSINKLGAFKHKIRESFGMDAVALLDGLIYGPSGKQVIRNSLNQLVDLGRNPNTPVVVLQQQASEVNRWIDELNQGLRDLHDMILATKK